MTPRRRVSAAVSWLLILASVAYLAAGRPLQEALAPRDAARATPNPLPTAAPIQLRLAARYAVGVHQLTGQTAATGRSLSMTPATGPRASRT